MKWKPYPSYTATDIPGLEQIPAHWEVRKMKLIADVRGGIAKGKDLTGQDTVRVPYLRVANVQDGFLNLTEVEEIEIPQRELERYLLQPGDVLMNEGGDFDKLGRGCVWKGDVSPCIHQNHVFSVRPRLVQSEWLNTVSGSAYAQFFFMGRAKQSTNLASISATNLAEFPVVMPPVGEQDQILTYLDRETTKIDALIAEQRTLIEWLGEKRRAEITRAVTEGFHLSPTLKPSGNPWIGSIPSHWEIKQIRHVTWGLDQGWSPQAEDRNADPEEWAVIKLSAIKQGRFLDSEHKALPANLEIPVGLEIKGGDLLFTRANTPELVGDVCVVDLIRPHLLFSDLVFRPQIDPDQVDARFLMYFLLSGCGRAQIECTARGSSQSMVKISQGLINSWQLPVPPLVEQKEIASALDRDMGNLDRLIKESECSIALLLERRAALITAVVTGKVDVRDAPKETA